MKFTIFLATFTTFSYHATYVVFLMNLDFNNLSNSSFILVNISGASRQLACLKQLKFCLKGSMYLTCSLLSLGISLQSWEKKILHHFINLENICFNSLDGNEFINISLLFSRVNGLIYSIGFSTSKLFSSFGTFLKSQRVVMDDIVYKHIIYEIVPFFNLTMGQ